MSGLSRSARVRGRDILLAELTKIVTLPACRWSLLASLLINVALTALEFAGVRISTGGAGVGVRQVGHLTVAPAYGILALAVFAAGSEYHNGQVRVSLLAQPIRHRLFSAKLFAVALTAAAAAAASVPTMVGASGLDVARATAWAGVSLALAIVGFGLTLIARSVLVAFAVATVAALADWTGLFPGSVGMFLPHGAALAGIGMSPFGASALSPSVGFLVLGCWSVTAVAAAALVFSRRDA